MRKTSIFLALFCAGIVACNNEKIRIKTDCEKLKIKGKVQNITEIYYLPVVLNDTIKQGERTSNAPSFFELDDEPFISYESVLYFNRDGNIAECVMTDSATDFYFREIFEYSGDLLMNKEGLLSDEFFYKQVFAYDSKKREKKRDFYDRTDHLFESVSIEYIDENNLVETVNTDAGGTNFERKIRLKNGLPVSSESAVKSLQIERWTGEYDSLGQITLSELYDEGNNLAQRVKYEYDSLGNEITCTISSADEQIVEYVYMYKYDEYNNWIQRATVADNCPEVIMVRKIAYYE
ncbi:MAG: hypothetical protein LBD59_05965 [Prevotellaceae bacterium]|jgi:hypothetical protein|nr:hypothetical protein [Prevotellaceae bacterium]